MPDRVPLGINRQPRWLSPQALISLLFVLERSCRKETKTNVPVV
jgi:hypothetical protein